MVQRVNWAKDWIDACLNSFQTKDHDLACGILADLQEAGALKDPPKPREWWLCLVCFWHHDELTPVPEFCPSCGPSSGKLTRVREVLDNEDHDI